MSTGIIIISLGSGDPDLMNLKSLCILKESDNVILRTGRHPFVSWLEQNGVLFSTLDSLYEDSDDFDLLNRNAAELLIRKAQSSEIVYAVPDHLTDQTVRELFRCKPDNLQIRIIPGISSCDRFLSSCLGFLSDGAVVSIPASEISSGFRYDPNCNLLVTELDNELLAGQVKIFLSDILADEHHIYLLREYAEPVSIPVWKLDRLHDIDHRCAVLIPGSGFMKRNRFIFNDLVSLMDNLRSPSGCPWDREQTHMSLRSYLVEEAWECVACIDQQDTDHLCEELGDLLFQIVFHSSIGHSFDEFTVDDVITSICLKMIRRHPHVFGSAVLNDPESVRVEWEKIKRDETGHCSAVSSLEDVSDGLPALKYAAKLMKKLKGTAMVRSSDIVLNDILEQIHSLRTLSPHSGTDSYGRLLLLCSELCCAADVDGELMLHRAADKLKKQLKSAEKKIISDGKSLEDLTFGELGVYLNHVEDEIE